MPVPDTGPGPIAKLLIANRGEIAARIIRSAHALGLATVAVYSDPDADAPYVMLADEAVRLPGAAPADTYLRGDLIIAAAATTGADAVHPGYGFLSENAAFARACADAGLIFVGPAPETIAAMGDKVAAKAAMADGGRARAARDDRHQRRRPGRGEPNGSASRCWSRRRSAAAAAACGWSPTRRSWPKRWPVPAAKRRRRSATAPCSSSGSSPTPGTSRCRSSATRRAPWSTCSSANAPSSAATRRSWRSARRRPWTHRLRAALAAAAVTAGQAIGYTGAGTVEFVLDRDGSFYFLEMNTRLQVEHPVTEEVTGLDLVELQLRIAEGEPLPLQAREAQINGHAIEVRLYAEDVPAGFVPATGTLHRFAIPAAPGIRVETGFGDGSVVSPHYDAMLAKVIAHGRTRADAARRLARALRPSRDPRRDHQPRPARGDPARARLPRRRHRHRLPDPPRSRRARRARYPGHGYPRAGRGAGPAGAAPRRGAGPGHAAVWLAQRLLRAAARQLQRGGRVLRRRLPHQRWPPSAPR